MMMFKLKTIDFMDKPIKAYPVFFLNKSNLFLNLSCGYVTHSTNYFLHQLTIF